MIMISYLESRDGTFIVLSLESLNLFNIGDIMLDLSEGRQRLRRNRISQILLNLHWDLNSIQRIQTMLNKWTCLGHTYINIQIPCL